MTEHTKGSWTIDRPADRRKPTRIMGGQTLPGAIGPPTIAVMKAGTYLDARLIECAPDMLEALTRLIWALDPPTAHSEQPELGIVIAEARAIISKAEGKTP